MGKVKQVVHEDTLLEMHRLLADRDFQSLLAQLLAATRGDPEQAPDNYRNGFLTLSCAKIDNEAFMALITIFLRKGGNFIDKSRFTDSRVSTYQDNLTSTRLAALRPTIGC